LFARRGGFFLRSIRKVVARVIGEFRPDVLLGCWAYPDGWAAVKLAREAGLPAVVKVHGSDVLVAGRDPARRSSVAEALCEADRVVAVSRDLAQHVAELGADPGKIHVVRNGVDGELFSPRDRGAARERLGLSPAGKIVLFVGNILLSKGAGVLVEACAALKRRGVAFECHLVGSGRDERTVRSLIARRGLSDDVKLAGQCAYARLPDWYAACDVVALPSFSEGLPNVLQEALACHRPFVASEVGGIPEIAHPSYSRLTPPGETENLAAALAEALLEPPTVDPELAALGVCTWEASADALAEALRAAIADRAPAPPQAEFVRR
jgi:glycosyltransferase involved in cell wall biosynthesis